MMTAALVLPDTRPGMRGVDNAQAAYAAEAKPLIDDSERIASHSTR